jgi:hypothetical protein
MWAFHADSGNLVSLMVVLCPKIFVALLKKALLKPVANAMIRM